ncbi:MAG: hypothetical protein Fur0010_06820 [Bdellovibrio sp.]
MKAFLVILFSTFSLALFAQETAQIVSFGEGFKLKYQDKEYDVVISGGTPSFKKVLDYPGPGVKLLVYFSGTAGTFRPIDIERAIVLDRKTGVNYGDYPYSYRPIDGTTYPQPKWEFKKKSVTIVDETFEINKVINIGN